MRNPIIHCSLLLVLALSYATAEDTTFDRQEHRERLAELRELRGALAKDEDEFRESLGTISRDEEWEAIRQWRLDRSESFNQLRDLREQINEALPSTSPVPAKDRTHSSTLPEETRHYLSERDALYRESLLSSSDTEENDEEWELRPHLDAEDRERLRELRAEARAALVEQRGDPLQAAEIHDDPELRELQDEIRAGRRQLLEDYADATIEERNLALRTWHLEQALRLRDRARELEEDSDK